MKTSKKLKEERAAKITEAQGLVSLAETEKREFNADEQTKFDALNTEIERFDTEILSAEKREKLTLRNVQTTPVTFETTTEEKETREKSKFSFSKLVLMSSLLCRSCARITRLLWSTIIVRLFIFCAIWCLLPVLARYLKLTLGLCFLLLQMLPLVCYLVVVALVLLCSLLVQIMLRLL